MNKQSITLKKKQCLELNKQILIISLMVKYGISFLRRFSKRLMHLLTRI